ncbi:U-box domain-containing protein 52-like [Triticum dicoccoides]|nr:U-box domain-containing protein 52-like [Triticum dicoccoides]
MGRYDGGKEAADTQLGYPLVAVCIDKDKNSQNALKWAIDSIVGKGQTIVLVHVNTKGVSGGVEDAAGFKQPTDPSLKELFLPFRCFCTRKDIQCKDVVLDDHDVGKSIIEFAAHGAVEKLVTGACTRGGFVRFKADIPTTICKGAPDFCTVYVINKGNKVSAQRNSIRPAPRVSPLRSQIVNMSAAAAAKPPEPAVPVPTNQKWSMSSRGSDNGETPRVDTIIRSPFTRGSMGPTRKSYADLSHMSMPDSADISFVSSGGRRSTADVSDISFISSNGGRRSIDYYQQSAPRMSNGSSLDSYDHSFEMTPNKWGGDSFTGGDMSFSQSSASSFCSSGMDDVEAEMKRLRLELKQTMDMYSTACKEALNAKQKANELQRWKAEEEQKRQDQHITEESALQMIEREKAKAKAAMEAAEASQRIAELEVQKRISAEKKLLKEAEERKHRGGGGGGGELRYRRYTIEEIEQATSHFDDARKVGEGGYGPVYNGYLDHTQVAIKVLRPDAAQGRSQFQQEVEVLSCIRHPNMVLLLGACPEYGCLVYEYMANGSLDDCLFRRGGATGGPVIPWQHRFRICAEIATGLLFLHQKKPEPLVHRDLKPGNILLDRNYVSKISDVGLARLVPPTVADTVTQYRMTSTAGTFCYIDPEYQQTGMLGVKSDVYSLGVMLLQIITAKPPMGLTHHIGRALERGTLGELLDPAVPDWPVEEAQCLAEMALRCCELRRKDRPDLGNVVLPELNRLRALGEDNMQFCGGAIRGGHAGGMHSSAYQSNVTASRAAEANNDPYPMKSVFSRASEAAMPPRRTNV